MKLHIGVCALLWSVLLLGCSSSVAPQSSEGKSNPTVTPDNSTDVAKATESAGETAVTHEPAKDEGGPVLIGPGVSAPADAPPQPESDAS